MEVVVPKLAGHKVGPNGKGGKLDHYRVLKGSDRAMLTKKQKAKAKKLAEDEELSRPRKKAQMRWNQVQLDFWKNRVRHTHTAHSPGGELCS